MTTGRHTDRCSSTPRSARLPRIALTVLVLGGLGAAPLRAQASGRGFLFQEPRASLTLRGGFGHANARSDLFDEVIGQFTLDRSDFSGVSGGLDLAVAIAPRLDLVLASGVSGTNRHSEYRDFVDNDDLPIEQSTQFLRVPVTVGLKAYLLPRGRAVGQFAWIPARVSPYIGAGAGGMWYQFEQSGDFIDFETNDVFADTFASHRWTTTAHALGGLEYALNARLALAAEGKYEYAKGSLSDDFQGGFDKIDLSGFSATLGLQVRF